MKKKISISQEEAIMHEEKFILSVKEWYKEGTITEEGKEDFITQAEDNIEKIKNGINPYNEILFPEYVEGCTCDR